MKASPSSRSSFEKDLAPHVDEKWSEKFVIELRLQGVSGETLGAALAEVDSHLAESGQDAHEAFGDPANYAKSLDLPTDPTQHTRAIQIRALIPTVVQVIGLIALTRALPDVGSPGGVQLTTGDFVFWGLVAAAIAALIWAVDPLIRLVVTGPIVAVGVVVVLFALLPVPLLLWQQPVLEVPVLGMALVGGILLVVGSVWEILRIRAQQDTGEITAPLDDPQTLQRRRAFNRRMNYLRVVSFPAIAIVGVAVVLILS